MKDPEKSELMELIRTYANLYYMDGIVAGMETAGNECNQKSGMAFAAREDSKAQILREIGSNIKNSARNMRDSAGVERTKQQDKIYKEIIGHLEALVEIRTDEGVMKIGSIE